MPIPSSEAAADAVKTALNGAGLNQVFARNRWPVYDLKELSVTKADVVCEWPLEVDPHNDGGVANETRIAVLLQRHCEKTNVALVDELTSLVEAIAVFLARTNIEGLGLPVAKLTVGRDDELLHKALFVGGVGVTYRRFTDYPPEDDFP